MPKKVTCALHTFNQGPSRLQIHSDLGGHYNGIPIPIGSIQNGVPKQSSLSSEDMTVPVYTGVVDRYNEQSNIHTGAKNANHCRNNLPLVV